MLVVVFVVVFVVVVVAFVAAAGGADFKPFGGAGLTAVDDSAGNDVNDRGVALCVVEAASDGELVCALCVGGGIS